MKKHNEVRTGLEICGSDGYGLSCEKCCPYNDQCKMESDKEGIMPGTSMMRDALQLLDDQTARVRALAECVEGAVKRYIYFCMKRSPQRDRLPQDGLIAFVDHGERRYIPRIDDVAWGIAIYSRELMPWEIARYELRANPRDA